MTKALDAAIRAAEEAIEDPKRYAKYEDVARAILRAALPAEPPEWFVTLYSRYTSYQGSPRFWADFRAHLLGEDT